MLPDDGFQTCVYVCVGSFIRMCVCVFFEQMWMSMRGFHCVCWMKLRGLLVKVIYTKLHANKQNEKSLQSSRLCVCVLLFMCVCVCVMHWCVCVSQKSNGNENNEARFCAHISKARQKDKKKNNPRRQENWVGCQKDGGCTKKKYISREIVRCVKLKKYINFLLPASFCSNPLHWPHHFRHFAHVL